MRSIYCAFLAVHCEWEWGSYSVCSVSCGNGVRTRFPIITKQAKHGGRPCPLSVRRNDTESQACGGTGCPGMIFYLALVPLSLSLSVSLSLTLSPSLSLSLSLSPLLVYLIKSVFKK